METIMVDILKADRLEKMEYVRKVMKMEIASNIAQTRLDEMIKEFVAFIPPGSVGNEQPNSVGQENPAPVGSSDAGSPVVAQQVATAEATPIESLVTPLPEPQETRNLVEQRAPSGMRTGGHRQGTKRVWIMIHEDDIDRQPVFVGLNGKGYAITRGAKVAVPVGVAEILRNAIKTVYRKIGEPGAEKLIARNVPMYPFSEFGEAS